MLPHYIRLSIYHSISPSSVIVHLFHFLEDSHGVFPDGLSSVLLAVLLEQRLLLRISKDIPTQMIHPLGHLHSNVSPRIRH